MKERKASTESRRPRASKAKAGLSGLAELQAVSSGAGTTCEFGGETYNLGDTVCYEKEEWRCTSTGWQKTGKPCS